VTLKQGGSRKLFLAHDGDGETMLYLNLARRLPEDVTVYGIEPRRIKGVPLAHARIEDMAAFHVRQLRTVQPYGPYLLGGMCAGGVIAYEMAGQLMRLGETVDLVAILDAATPQAQKRAGRVTGQRLGRMTQALAVARDKRLSLAYRLFSTAGIVSRKIMNALIWEATARARRLSVRARFLMLHRVLDGGRQWPRLVPELSIREIYESAEAGYQPQPLLGAGVLLVRAQKGEGGDTPYRDIYADDTFGWRAVVADVVAVDVDGGHSSLLQEPHVASLASLLRERLDRHDALPPRTVSAPPTTAA
jgi:thioesterase domain-containing protein